MAANSRESRFLTIWRNLGHNEVMSRSRPTWDSATPETRETLRLLCRSLCKALLQTAWYPADHPQAVDVCAEPYARLFEARETWRELTFTRMSLDERDRTLTIEGVFDDSPLLEAVIGGAAGEHFNRKLHDYCIAHGLISFTLRTHVSESELRRFVSCFVHTNLEPGVLDKDSAPITSKEAPLTQRLLDNQVHAVSLVLEQELVRGRRHIPWRVRIALSRLRKDLRVLPLYEDASGEELRQAKVRLLRDILRPLMGAVWLVDFFLNFDLIADEVESLHGGPVEDDFMALLKPDLIVQLATRLMAEYDAPVSAESGVRGVLQKQLCAAGNRLREEHGTQGAHQLLRDLARRGIISFDELPAALRGEMEIERLVQEARDAPDAYLLVLEDCKNAQAYRARLYDTLRVWSRALGLSDFTLADLITDTITRHRGDHDAGFVGRSDIANTCLSNALNPHVTDLIRALPSMGQPARLRVRRLLLTLGRTALPTLIEALWVLRRGESVDELALTLVEMGAEGAAGARAALAEGGAPAETIITLVRVLERLSDSASVRVITEYSRHPSPQVRCASLDALLSLQGHEVQPVVERALGDGNADVVTHAIRLCERLRGTPADPSPALINLAGSATQPQSVRIAAVGAVTRLAVTPRARVQLESELLQLLGDRDTPKRFGLFRVNKPADDDALRVTVCDALAAIGGPRSLSRMARHDLEPSPAVRQAMARAFAKLSQPRG